MNEQEQPKTAALKPPVKIAPQSETFSPRRLKVITGTARGMYLADADTGEDLRLPIMSINVEPTGAQPCVHFTCHVAGVGPR